MKVHFAPLLALFAVLSGCMLQPETPPQPPRSYIAIRVDALRDAEAPARQSYALFPGIEGVSDGDLQYREVARYVRQALGARGFTEAADPAKAGIALFLNYGIGEPRTTYFTYSFPVLGILGPQSYSFRATTPGKGGHTTTGTLEPFPDVGVVGTGTRLGSATFYMRFLVIEAIDVARSREAKKTIPTWKTIVTSPGPSDDLRRILPALVVAGQPYFGEHTDHQIDLQLEETDPAVLAMRRTE